MLFPYCMSEVKLSKTHGVETRDLLWQWWAKRALRAGDGGGGRCRWVGCYHNWWESNRWVVR